MNLDGCIYLSTSWKLRDRVRALAITLRGKGHSVYDFTDPSCRNVPEIPPEAFPELFDPAIHNYREYLNRNPSWRQAVECNREALQKCRAVVLMLPCGNDAHADAFYGLGLGKPLVVCGQSRAGERTPTHMWADAILDCDEDVAAWLDAQRPCVGYGSPYKVCGRTPTVRVRRVYTAEEKARSAAWEAGGMVGHYPTDLLELPPPSYCEECEAKFISFNPNFERISAPASP